MFTRQLFEAFNHLYFWCYPIYKPAYWLYKRVFDAQRLAHLRTVVRPGMVVLDVGANIGFYTRFLSKLVGPSGLVYAFEPDRLNYQRLQQNVVGLDNVRTVPVAVGSRTEKLRLYVSGKMNVDHQTYDSGESRRFVEVECVALDDHLSDLAAVGFMKIDIQGYDCEAIRGSRRLLGRSPHVAILGELWPYGLKTAGTLPSVYLRELQALGFTVKIITSEAGNVDAHVDQKDFHTDFIAVKG